MNRMAIFSFDEPVDYYSDPILTEADIEDLLSLMDEQHANDLETRGVAQVPADEDDVIPF